MNAFGNSDFFHNNSIELQLSTSFNLILIVFLFISAGIGFALFWLIGIIWFVFRFFLNIVMWCGFLST